jgi:hypothetical protein
VKTTASVTAASGATVSSFKITQQPACPIVATTDAPFSKPGVDIKLSWSVTGASKVALSLDSPNFYAMNGTGSIGEYAATDTVDLPFECDVTVQPNTTHVYTLNTVSTPTAAKSITVTVRTSP